MLSHRQPVTIRLQHFEGPLDLLLHLIQAHELNISSVSVSRITDQYLATVKTLLENDFDLAGEFLVMAATLLLWKSRALLPQDPSQKAEPDEGEGSLSPEELIQQLFDHQLFLAAGDELSTQHRLGEHVFARSNAKPPVERIWREMDITSLAVGYLESLVRSRRRVKILQKETVSVGDKIREIGMKLTIGTLIDLRALMPPDPTRGEVVVTLLASLELSRIKKMRTYQMEAFDPVMIELLSPIEGLDLALIEEFKPQKALV